VRNRTEASILEGRRYTVVLAALVASVLLFAMWAFGGVAFAQDEDDGDGEGGGVNLQATDCSQIQAIFINLVVNNDDDDDDDGEDTTTTAVTKLMVPPPLLPLMRQSTI
jgi:hypothetical protein